MCSLSCLLVHTLCGSEGAKPWTCPHQHCRGDEKPFAQGYVVNNGTSRGQPRAWRTACEASGVLRYGTAYYGLQADPAIGETAVRAFKGAHHSS